MLPDKFYRLDDDEDEDDELDDEFDDPDNIDCDPED